MGHHAPSPPTAPTHPPKVFFLCDAKPRQDWMDVDVAVWDHVLRLLPLGDACRARRVCRAARDAWAWLRADVVSRMAAKRRQRDAAPHQSGWDGEYVTMVNDYVAAEDGRLCLRRGQDVEHARWASTVRVLTLQGCGIRPARLARLLPPHLERLHLLDCQACAHLDALMPLLPLLVYGALRDVVVNPGHGGGAASLQLSPPATSGSQQHTGCLGACDADMAALWHAGTQGGAWRIIMPPSALTRRTQKKCQL